jgi:hypothetical protein
MIPACSFDILAFHVALYCEVKPLQCAAYGEQFTWDFWKGLNFEIAEVE